MSQLVRKVAAETVGTAFLVATVVGSGIMAAELSAGNDGVALLANALATGAILAVLILIFGPVSGAHFNPAVSFAFLLRREIGASQFMAYSLFQIGGGLAGTLLAHLMFELPLVQPGTHIRTGIGNWTGEMVATFALVLTILACLRHAPKAVPYAVGLVIMAGYWYTSSTSFANPAVTVARTITDTFSSIRPADAAPFVAIQLIAAGAAALFARWLFEAGAEESKAVAE